MEGGEEEANCNGGSGDSNREQVHIAIMRRRTSNKDSHISDVRPATDTVLSFVLFTHAVRWACILDFGLADRRPHTSRGICLDSYLYIWDA